MSVACLPNWSKSLAELGPEPAPGTAGMPSVTRSVLMVQRYAISSKLPDTSKSSHLDWAYICSCPR